MEEPSPVRFEGRVPDEIEAGVYANVLNVWHSPHEFTLDFGVLQRAEPDLDDPDVVVVPWRLVARVRIATTVVFDFLRAVNENMTRYERTYGPIQYPRNPGDLGG